MTPNDADRRELDGSIEWDELHPATKKLLSRRRFIAGGATGIALFGSLPVFLAACGSSDTKKSAAPPTTTTSGPSLYTRLGGNAAITAVIADFVDKQVVPDTRINHFFANTDLTRLKMLLTQFTDHATGGPEAYTGRDMKTTHAGLKITVADFNALVEDLSKSLDVYKVPAKEKDELLSALAPLQSDIVTA